MSAMTEMTKATESSAMDAPRRIGMELLLLNFPPNFCRKSITYSFLTIVLEYFMPARSGRNPQLQDGTMLRSFLIYLSKAAWAQRIVTRWGFAWKAASRFVAGETVQDAIRVVRELNARGIRATLDRLGEHTSNVEEANSAADSIVEVLNEIDKAGVKANVSIKLTQIGMGLDEEICRQNLVRILEQAKKLGNFIRIDMEDSPYTDITLSMFDSMMARGFASCNVGLVIQSYLFRSEADTRRILQKETRIRLVKGAYNELPDKAYARKSDTDANFDLLSKIILDAISTREGGLAESNGHLPPFLALGTHDANRIDFARKQAEKIGLPKGAVEFQMLYGIRRDLQEQLVRDGFPVRVYIPFGTHWYPYFIRRLAERPANIWFFISQYFRG